MFDLPNNFEKHIVTPFKGATHQNKILKGQHENKFSNVSTKKQFSKVSANVMAYARLNKKLPHIET
jgi:hypothetical protein